MYHFLLSDQTFDPLDEEDLAQFERDYHLCLPDQLKDYLKKYNGAAIHPCSFSAGNIRLHVEWILPLYKSAMSADRMLDLLRPARRLPQSYYPLACSDEDYDFFLDTKSGHVYAINIENPSRQILAAVGIDGFFSRIEHAVLKEEMKQAGTESTNIKTPDSGF